MAKRAKTPPQTPAALRKRGFGTRGTTRANYKQLQKLAGAPGRRRDIPTRQQLAGLAPGARANLRQLNKLAGVAGGEG